jgi:hypothetical protein
MNGSEPQELVQLLTSGLGPTSHSILGDLRLREKSMRPNYRQWLVEQKYDAGTVTAQMHRAGRVEDCHGNLDEHYNQDHMDSLIGLLRYSRDDERRNRPNPSKIPFKGDIYNNLASYRNATERYRKFRDAGGETIETTEPPSGEIPAGVGDEEPLGRRIGLERDMQAALRIEIGQLELGLAIIDDGAERSVGSGFIDITARDASGSTVIIELKAGVAGQRAVAQILSYMGDIMAEEGPQVRGILIASDFDGRAKAAARVVPNLSLRKYSVRFLFTDGHA